MKKCWVILIAALFMSGCVGARPKVNTASGRPEIEIKTSVKQLSAYLLGLGIEKDYRVKSQTENTLVLEKPETSRKGKLLYGTGYRDTPNKRITFNMYQKTPEFVKIKVTCEMVSNPGTGDENVDDLSEYAVRVQEFLQQVKDHFEGNAAVAPSLS